MAASKKPAAKKPSPPKKKVARKSAKKPKVKKDLVEYVEEPEVEADVSAEEKLKAEEMKRADWERNNEVISEIFLDYALKKRKFPSYEFIAKQTGLSERTVRRHFEKANILGDQTQKMQTLRDRSLLTIAIKAIKGDSVHWNRLFHEILDGNLGRKITATATTKADGVQQPQAPTGGKIETDVTLIIS